MTSPRLPGGDGSTGPRSPRLSPVLWAARQASGAYETQLPVASGVGMTHRLNSTRGQTGHAPASSHAVTSDVRVRLLMSQTLTLPDRIPRLASCWPGLFWGGVS